MKYLLILLTVFIVTCSSQNAIHYILHYSHKYKVDSRVIFAIIKAESSGKFNALSKAGAIGLMGIMPNTLRDHYKWLYKKTGDKAYKTLSNAPDVVIKKYLMNERINIRCGVWYFKYVCLKRSTGNYTLAINLFLNGPNSKKYDWKYVNKVIDEVVKWQ